MKHPAINPEWLAFFRISTAAFCLLHFFTLLPDIDYFIGYGGFVHAQILRPFSSHIVPTLYDIAGFVGDERTMQNTIHLFEISYILSLLLLLTGTVTRVAAILASLLHLILLTSFEIYSYGVDYFSSIMLFYCAIFPIGRVWSVDARLKFRWNKPLNEISSRGWLKLLQANLCIAYFFGGFDKLLGYNWWNGESIWKSIHLVYNPQLISLDAWPPIVFVIAGWTTIAVEILYPILMNIRRARPYWLVMVILLHLFICLFLGLFFFSGCMILLNISAYYAPYTKQLLPNGRASIPDMDPLITRFNTD